MYYEKILDKILIEYGMYHNFEKEYEKSGYEFNQKWEKVNAYINNQVQAFEKKHHHKPGAVIWGAGLYCEFLLSLSSVLNLNLVGIVDRTVTENGEKTIKGHTVYPLKKLEEWQYDMVLIASYASRAEMKNHVLDVLKKDCLDIFGSDERLEKGSLVGIPENKWEFKDSKVSLSVDYYLEVYQEQPTSKHLKELIKILLYIRDFCAAFQYMDLYVEKGFEDGQCLSEMKSKINELFVCMKKDISNRKNNNILLFLSDALVLDSCVDYMPFLRSDHHFFYNNVRSAAVYTGESLRTIFKARYLFDESLYLCNEVRAEDSSFREIIEQGYDFITYDWRYLLNNDSYIKRDINKRVKAIHSSYCASSMLWDYICYIAENEKNNMAFIRAEETHWPGINYLEKVEKDFDLNRLYDGNYFAKEIEMHEAGYRAKYSARLIDAQLCFYLNFLKNTDTSIVFSDHGFSELKDETVSFRKISVPIVLINKEMDGGETACLGSLTDLSEIVGRWILNKEIFIPDHSYVLTERMPLYGENLKNLFKEYGIEENTVAFRIISTDLDRYVYWQDGREEYYQKNGNKDEFETVPTERLEFFRTLNSRLGFPAF